MARSARFTAIPVVPTTGLDEAQAQLLNALKQNVELVIGTRGEADLASAAIVRSQITVSTPPTQTMTRVTAQGNGATISGVNVVLLEDYIRLLQDTQRLANDVAALRAVVEALVVQLKG